MARDAGRDDVTFGGSGLDRAAALRTAPDRIQAEFARGEVLPFWQGKPLLGDETRTSLGWLPSASKGLIGREEPVFLGLDDGVPKFALDISDWQPATGAPGPLDSFADGTEQVHPDYPRGTRFVELRACMTGLSPREAELAAMARGLLQWHARHRFCANCGAPTRPACAGWQRTCDRCDAIHHPRTDPVVIMLVTHGNSLLIGRSPHWPEGMYSLLAGFVEPGETPEAAVRREVLEEAGIEVGKVRYILSQPWPFPTSLMLACRGEALGRDIRLDPAELDDARWVTREEAMDIFAGEHPDIRAARPGSVARHVIGLWLADELEPL